MQKVGIALRGDFLVAKIFFSPEVRLLTSEKISKKISKGEINMKKSESTNEMVNEVASEIMNEMENEVVTEVSYGEVCKPSSMSRPINRSPALEAEYKGVFGEKFSNSALSKRIATLDAKKAKRLFKNEKGKYPNNYFFNAVLTNKIDRENIENKSTRLSRSDWEFIDSVMTKTDNDKVVTRRKSNYIFFLAFLIYYEKNKNTNNKIFPIEKTDMEDFSRPIFHLMGNKKWFKKVFPRIIKQLLTEKIIEVTVDLFGGSGFLTGCVRNHCSKNNIALRSIYNDLDDEKINFLKQLQEHPKKLEKKCKKLLETYDYYQNKGEEESILQLRKEAEGLKRKNGLQGAAAFWYVQTTNKKGEVNLKKRKALEGFAYDSKLYEKVEIKNSDALYCFQQWFNNEKAFIMIDPPYPFTLGYLYKHANEDFSLRVHNQLYNKMLIAKATWIYFGRIDAPKSHTGNQNEAKATSDDAQHLALFDDTFQDKGLFYMDKKVGKNTERIVSNYPFEGFKPYVSGATSSLEEESADEEMIVPSVENAVEETIAFSIGETKEEVDISPSVEDTDEEITTSSVETTTEETTIETPVHTEPSSVEEIVTDNHKPVVEEKMKKKRKGVFGKLLDFFQSF